MLREFLYLVIKKRCCSASFLHAEAELTYPTTFHIEGSLEIWGLGIVENPHVGNVYGDDDLEPFRQSHYYAEQTTTSKPNRGIRSSSFL